MNQQITPDEKMMKQRPLGCPDAAGVQRQESGWNS